MLLQGDSDADEGLLIVGTEFDQFVYGESENIADRRDLLAIDR